MDDYSAVNHTSLTSTGDKSNSGKERGLTSFIQMYFMFTLALYLMLCNGRGQIGYLKGVYKLAHKLDKGQQK